MDSGFFQLGAGTAFSTPFLGSENLKIYGGVNLSERITFTESDFRTRVANGQLGLRYRQGKNTFIASILGQRYYLGGDTDRDSGGGTVQWLHSFSQRTQVSVFGQLSVQRYPGQAVRNVNQYSIGLGLVHALTGQGDAVIFAGVFGGTDEELSNSRQDIGRKFVGFRVGGQYSLQKDLLLVGNLSYQFSHYGDDDPLFNETRSDHFIFTRFGVNYNLTKNWSILPEIQYIYNDSKLLINEFDRWQLFMSVRNNF